jgi:magnesium transporter
MSVIAAYYYNKGNRVQKLALDEHVELDRDRSGFCWIALHDPTPEELRAIQVTYNLHPLTIDNAMHPLCPPSSKSTTTSYTSSLRPPSWSATESVTARWLSSPAIIMITVRHGEGGALGSLRGQLEASPPLLGKGVDYVLHAILHRIVDQYLPIFETIEDNVLAMEKRSLDDF